LTRVINFHGAELEAQNYGLAAQLAKENGQYTAVSTALKEAQTSRELNMSLGKTQAEVAGAGFSLSGSALDILRSSAQQGALQKAAIQQQGNITEAGYAEQAQSYLNMQQAANATVKGDGARTDWQLCRRRAGRHRGGSRHSSRRSRSVVGNLDAARFIDAVACSCSYYASSSRPG
jgi:hypothetical protein